ncbi:membrane protein [Amylibacter ulvae]|uniref:Membrane protein n=2 Tax=Paramylibacter ulvae TaxID=1651968 RepID=A0ABQ3D316_9RHOB|nr:membrane protein [Amylibacter ulvae]
METLFLPFQFPFMVNAFLICVLVAIPAGLLSCYLVLKGWSLMGDAISHAVLPGVVLAYIFNFPMLIGAFFAGMICAVSTGYLTEHSRIKQDTIMGVVFSGMFALGIVLYTKIQTNVHLDHILFGNMLGISASDLMTTGYVSIFVAAAILLKWKDFMLHAFDEAQAKATGLNVNLLHYGLLVLISLTVIAALKAVGIILAIAFLVTPGGIAFLLTRRFSMMLIVSVAVAVGSSVIGIYASFFINSAPAPTIVLIMTAFFIVALVWSIRTTKRQSKLAAHSA